VKICVEDDPGVGFWPCAKSWGTTNGKPGFFSLRPTGTAQNPFNAPRQKDKTPLKIISRRIDFIVCGLWSPWSLDLDDR
jgi:hypothetical protein